LRVKIRGRDVSHEISFGHRDQPLLEIIKITAQLPGVPIHQRCSFAFNHYQSFGKLKINIKPSGGDR
jgi:hypothetical protein